jgi:hypothetical protein
LGYLCNCKKDKINGETKEGKRKEKRRNETKEKRKKGRTNAIYFYVSFNKIACMSFICT